MCGRTGTLLTFVPASQFKLLSGEDALTDYQFNKHAIHHLFCGTCGVKSFARGTGRDGVATVAINARCLEACDNSRPCAMPVTIPAGRLMPEPPPSADTCAATNGSQVE